MDNLDSYQEPSQESQQPAQAQHYRLAFYGDGMAYFKVWIVNIILTILTLGIYSAWAKVRNRRYFYGHLELDNARFEYLANPITILKGRLIAIGLFIAFNALTSLYPQSIFPILALFYLALPYLVIRSLAFNNSMSSFKNIQFGFDAKYGDAFVTFILWPLLAIVSLGILAPKAMAEFHRFIVSNSRYGSESFEFTATWKNYAPIFLIMIAISSGGGLLSLLLFIGDANPLISFAPVVMMAVYFGTYLYFQFACLQVFYQSVNLKSFRFKESFTMMEYTKVSLINALLIFLTLGLYFPAAKVRMTKFIADNLTVYSWESFDEFTASEVQKQNALGQETADVFDIEVGAF
ncbi:MAG: YjgN family protein [Cellvibrionales bacterium]|nr:YjgN family protein [Cellvibrionales bacterium]